MPDCRVGRLERDVLQKRTLLEDLRLKLRLAKESAKSDLQLLESKSEELARTKAISEQTKTTVCPNGYIITYFQ